MIVSSMPDVIVEGTVPVSFPAELQKYASFAAGINSKASLAPERRGHLALDQLADWD